MFKSPETTLYKLDHYIELYGRTLPQIVTVGKGFQRTSVNHTLAQGEVLIIYKIERVRKVLARDTRGRELCLPRTGSWKVEISSYNSEHEYHTLVDVPSRYFRVLQDIASFHLVAGDILSFSEDPIHLSKQHDLCCCLVSSQERVYINLPADLKGTFQALPNYGIFSMEQVLREFSLPLNVRLVPEAQTTAFNCSEQATTPIGKIGNIQIEREIEEKTVFVISPHKNDSILTFPKALDIFVAEYMPQHEFLSCSGDEFKQFLAALENDKVLQNTINKDCVYFTSQPIRRYSLELLQFPSFRFEKKERRAIAIIENSVTKRQQQELITEELTFDCPTQQQSDTGTFASEGDQPWSFSETQAPPLPPKMLTLAAGKYHVTSKKQVHYTESSQESEKHKNSSQMRSKQEAKSDRHIDYHIDCDDHLMYRDSYENTTRPFRLMPRPSDPTAMQFSEDNCSESGEAVFSVCEPQLDVNANFPVNSGIDIALVRKQGTLTNYAQPKQPTCNVPCSLSKKTWQQLNTATKRCKEHTMHKYGTSSTEQSFSDESNGTQLSLAREQTCISQNWEDVCFVNDREARSKERKIYKYSASSTEQSLSDEDDEEVDSRDFLDLSFHERFEDSCASDVPQRGEVENTTIDERVRHKSGNDTEEGSERVCHTNGDTAKKRLFHSLTRIPRWLRQDASKPPGKKEKGQESKVKSEAVRIPPRHAVSCEDLWISRPQDDFECMGNIRKYLDTRDKLTRALVKINHLEKQTSKSADTREQGSGQHRKAWRKEQDVEPQLRGLQGSQAMTPKQRSKQAPFTSALIEIHPSASLSPVRDCSTFNQSRNPSENEQSETSRAETNTTRLGMSQNPDALAASYDDSDQGYVLMLPNYGLQRDNFHLERPSKQHSIRRDKEDEELRLEDSNKLCLRSRNPHFTGVFSSDLSETAAKLELKKAILQMDWSEEEWMELTEIVTGRNMSNSKRTDIPYVNLAPQGKHGSLPMDQTVAAGSSCPGGDRGRKMPPYVNINQGQTQPYGQARQEDVSDMQRIANRSLGKPPIPTPRRGGSSV